MLLLTNLRQNLLTLASFLWEYHFHPYTVKNVHHIYLGPNVDPTTLPPPTATALLLDNFPPPGPSTEPYTLPIPQTHFATHPHTPNIKPDPN
jgi:hypothetical protein